MCSSVVSSNSRGPYAYDANGNLLSGGNRAYTWNSENQPDSIIGPDGVQETYTYDAEGRRVTRTRSNVTTFYLGGMVEEEGGTIRRHYGFGGQVVAQRSRTNGQDTVIYLHGDHLGSISAATSSGGALVSKQEFTPWGEVRGGRIGETTLNYTGQRKDATGLLYYGARYYDPGLGRFISADSIVPGTAGNIVGVGDGKLTPLTVDFHEPGFASTVGEENGLVLGKGFGDEETVHVGRGNPQALNRYSYVLNNPLRYTDPSGHDNNCFPVPGDGGCTGSGAEPLVSGGGRGGGGGGGGGSGGSGSPDEDKDRVPRGNSNPQRGGGGNNPPPIKPGSSGGPTSGKPFTKKQKDRTWEDDPSRTCVYCRRPGTAEDVDHKTPRSRGGNTEDDNRQGACVHCNRSKGNHDYPRTPPPGYEGKWPPDHWAE